MAERLPALVGVAAAGTYLQFRSLGSGDPSEEAFDVLMNPLSWPLAAQYYFGNDPMAVTHTTNEMIRESAAIFKEQNDWINWVKTSNVAGQSVGSDAVTRARDYIDAQAAFTLMFGVTPDGTTLSSQELNDLHGLVASPDYENVRNQLIGNERGRSGR